jgi:peptidoglycan/LPS O-acetylase OafA/YrhL
VRGYAILMVITSHLIYQFPNIPFVMHRLGAAGWYGVQLFFLASAVTLLMSWSFEVSKKGSADVRGFFIRRFFRIAPAYYAAGVFYYAIMPPAHFDSSEAISTALFINAWRPSWIPVDTSAWCAVPGGWSISVEFSFYAFFPVFATFVTSLRRALLFFVCSIVVGVVANEIAIVVLNGVYTPVQIGNFLFFWFPNELSVFALGGILFVLIRQQPAPRGWLRSINDHPTFTAGIAIALVCVAALSRPGHYLGAPPYIPDTLSFSVPLMLLILALSSGRGFLVNRFASSIGKVSFSAYLLHFAVLRLFMLFPQSFTHATQLRGVAAFVAGWIFAVSVTFAVALLSYLVIEKPMIGLGKALIASIKKRPQEPLGALAKDET